MLMRVCLATDNTIYGTKRETCEDPLKCTNHKHTRHVKDAIKAYEVIRALLYPCTRISDINNLHRDPGTHLSTYTV